MTRRAATYVKHAAGGVIVGAILAGPFGWWIGGTTNVWVGVGFLLAACTACALLGIALLWSPRFVDGARPGATTPASTSRRGSGRPPRARPGSAWFGFLLYGTAVLLVLIGIVIGVFVMTLAP